MFLIWGNLFGFCYFWVCCVLFFFFGFFVFYLCDGLFENVLFILFLRFLLLVMKRATFWKLSNLMMELFETRFQADFCFIVQGEKIWVHKYNFLIVLNGRWVLAVRSEKFRKLVLEKWKGKSEIFVKRFSYLAFEHFLEYVYSGSCGFSRNLADEVSDLAYKCNHEFF